MDKHDNIDTVKEDVRTGVDEMTERAKAGGEALKRAVAGDAMTPGEKLGSHVKEIGHDMKAGLDKMEREG